MSRKKQYVHRKNQMDLARMQALGAMQAQNSPMNTLAALAQYKNAGNQNANQQQRLMLAFADMLQRSRESESRIKASDRAGINQDRNFQLAQTGQQQQAQLANQANQTSLMRILAGIQMQREQLGAQEPLNLAKQALYQNQGQYMNTQNMLMAPAIQAMQALQQQGQGQQGKNPNAPKGLQGLTANQLMGIE